MRVNFNSKNLTSTPPVFSDLVQKSSIQNNSSSAVVTNVLAKDVFVDSTKIEKNKSLKPALMASSLIALAGTITFCMLKRKSPINVDTNATLKLFKEQMKEFPLDIPYREKIISKLSNKDIQPEALRPIIGPQEYTNILKEFNDSPVHYSPGDTLMTELKDDYNLANTEKGLYRANMHMHTVFSDGKIEIRKLLDDACEYANFVASKITESTKAKHAPFIIAITDHDTVKGCQKAVEIISENPKKYKNLRVILGCEMSVENKTISKELNSPISNHMLLHAINPFDDDLTKFLASKIESRINYAKEMMAEATQLLKKSKIKSDLDLKYEDSKDLYPILKHGLTHMYLSTKDYIQFRTIFSECFEKNKEIQEALVKKGIDSKALSYITPKNKYFNSINENFGNDYWKKYQKALTKYTSELLGITDDDAAKKINVTPEMEKYFAEVQSMIRTYMPTLEKNPAYIDIEDAINFMKKQEYGYIGLAHPALINPANSLKNPTDSIDSMKELITKFKELGGEKAKFIEIYYHYFGKGWDKGSGFDWLNTIKESAQKSGLLSSGSLDTHGTRIFYSG